MQSRNGVIRGYYVAYKQKNKYYRGNNLTVNGGDTRSYIIRNLAPYTAYIIEMQAFTRAGASPLGARREVRTHEDGMFSGRSLGIEEVILLN